MVVGGWKERKDDHPARVGVQSEGLSFQDN